MIAELEVVAYTLMGFLGAVAYRLAWSRTIDDLLKFESLRHMVLGLIIGFIYYNFHSSYGFPDTIMSFVAGWAGVDFLESIIERFSDAER